MSERERRDEVEPGSGGSSPLPAGGGNLGELRRAGEDLLAAGNESIRRALSGDSEGFLRSILQEGGQ